MSVYCGKHVEDFALLRDDIKTDCPWCRIAALDYERKQVHCEVGLWLDGDQTPLKALLNLAEILNMNDDIIPLPDGA